MITSLLAVAALGIACGPSVQSIYEGNVRFEHCYRLDLEVDTAPTHRQACWREWIHLYTYGQPRDRIEYAHRRLHAFAVGDTARPALDVAKRETKSPESRPFYLVVPAQTSVHASPPPIATRYYGDAGVAPPAATARAPEDACTSDCRSAYASCADPCDADASAPTPPCKACDPNYKTCMKRCFQ